jgi:regulator of sirC expression with transglutaminase-like and TPR domain
LARLIEIHHALGEPGDAHALLRSVNFMGYELQTLLRGVDTESALPILNRFFFEQKNFRLSATGGFSLGELVERREGAAVLLALIYAHLASSCGVKLQLVHWPMHTVLRCETAAGKYSYIDLECGGALLTPEEILARVCKHKKELLPLSAQESVLQYLSYLSLHLRAGDEGERLHKVLGLILAIEPENTRYLAERAILRRDLGLVKEALQDMKRYFSFTNAEASAPEMIAVYHELKAMAPALS